MQMDLPILERKEEGRKSAGRRGDLDFSAKGGEARFAAGGRKVTVKLQKSPKTGTFHDSFLFTKYVFLHC